MKNEKLNAELVWKQLDDQLVPPLRLSAADFLRRLYRERRLNATELVGASVSGKSNLRSVNRVLSPLLAYT
jgi:hypothetical protein